MNEIHRRIRDRLRRLPLPNAREFLQPELPEQEFLAVYLADCERLDLFAVGERLGCTDHTVKKIRQRAYEKLAVRETE